MESRVRPIIINDPNQLCVYINLHDEKKPESSSKSKSPLKDGPDSQRSNIRRKLTTQMQKQGWECEAHITSFIFYKDMASDDKKSDPVEKALKESDLVEKAHKEISVAIEETTKTYEGAQFQYGIMRPLTRIRMFEARQTVEEQQNKAHEEGMKTEIKEEIVEEGSPFNLNDMKNNLPSTSS
ncbi:Ulp1 protease family, C-terminal catalytic domain containing protein [Caenorhabditis elegans]|uniref:Ulp1 protease family, C-terminal catalytic domain containing protein n=1 Tax=Caenorhabditis elegans TaxID=6239 RepID=Q75MI6_CAEEL|nr:Ulp1 protease family, C-terminal catalytic domain containing protein [Caenorhabditis elegans]CCD74211.1 Ulp1 protease family, C-terminal catalytic domain containing protein [Caenorhabditis elegans]|eukprot:NP_001023589.1 Uncharacterized protein CELE_Y94H6A.10 [Caenorhabditis elegans]